MKQNKEYTAKSGGIIPAARVGRSEPGGRGCKYSKPTTRCGRNDSLSGGNCDAGVYGSCLSEYTDHI